jgi:hypothetical protein
MLGAISVGHGAEGGMSDNFTETTSRSWVSRIGNSIKGVLFGLLMIIGSTVLLFWNEGRAVQTARSLDEGAAAVIDVSPAKVDPANEGKLVHISGDVKAAARIGDPEFGVSAAALRLLRSVEMYQWKEESKSETRKTLGGSEETVTTYTYHRVWSETRNDSSRFRQPGGHENPAMRYQRYAIAASDATLGAFRPGAAVLQQLPASEPVRVDAAIAKAVNSKLKIDAHANDGRLYLGADPGAPRVGDLRIAFTMAPQGPVSIIGRQTGSDFSQYQTKAGDRLLMVRPGARTADEMFKAARDENRILTWVLRLIGAVVMFIGFAMILQPLVVVADVVPLIGNILGAGASLVSLVLTALLAPLVIAIAWLWYRPLVSVIVIAIGIGLAFLFRTLAARKAAARAGQPVPT